MPWFHKVRTSGGVVTPVGRFEILPDGSLDPQPNSAQAERLAALPNFRQGVSDLSVASAIAAVEAAHAHLAAVEEDCAKRYSAARVRVEAAEDALVEARIRDEALMGEAPEAPAPVVEAPAPVVEAPAPVVEAPAPVAPESDPSQPVEGSPRRRFAPRTT